LHLTTDCGILNAKIFWRENPAAAGGIVLNADAKNILLVRTDRIGDVILSLPMLPLLRRRFPRARISVLVRRYTQELVENHSCVDEALVYENEDSVVSLWRTLKRLRERKFDLAIIPYPRFRSTLLTFLAGIRLRIGTGYRWYSFLLNKKVYEHRKDAKRHEVEYNLNLLRSLGIETDGTPQFEFTIPSSKTEFVDAFLADNLLSAEGRFAVLHPGSGGSARDWRAENFSRLGDMIYAQLGMKVLVSGGNAEKTLVHKVVDGMKTRPIAIVGKFSLMELGALLRRAKVFVSNSTGPMHLAAIVGTPVVAFFPPIVQCSPVRWGPYTRTKKVFLADNKTCTLCLGSPCRSNVCMDQITVEDVLLAIKQLLNDQKQTDFLNSW
jgi:lipopolysaccharide heptosyltransferase II